LGKFLFPINPKTLSLKGAGDSLGYLCKKYSAKANSKTYCPKKHNLECPDLTCLALVRSQLGCWNAKYNKVSNCLAGLSSPNLSLGSKGYPKACLASNKYSSIQVWSALFSLEEGKQELNNGNCLRDSWGLFKNLCASLLSSSGGLSMNLLGGILFFGDVVFLRSASSLRSLWGLFLGSSCGSIATAKTPRFCRVLWWGLRYLIWRGKGAQEDEKEMSDIFGNWEKEEESSITGLKVLKEMWNTSNLLRTENGGFWFSARKMDKV